MTEDERSAKARKLLIVGLDGATFDIIRPLIDKGYLPSLQKIIETGGHAPMQSTVPPISGPAWLSLATGLEPRQTQVFDFTYRKDKEKYKLSELSSTDFNGRTIWDYLSKARKRVGILNYPMCFPVYEVNGFMTAGIGASTDGVYTFPEDLKEELNNAAGGEYELYIGYHKSHYEDTDLFINDLKRILTKKFNVAKYLLKEKPWDFFWFVLSETDWLQHIMWRHIDQSHPLNEGESSKRFSREFKELWRLIDDGIGELYDIAGEKTNIIIHSDHGFGSNDEVFKINVWLEREGYLVWKKMRGRVLTRTKALICIFGERIVKCIRLNKLLPRLYNWGRTKKDKILSEILDEIDLERSVAFDPGHTIPFSGIYINNQLIKEPHNRQKFIDEIREKLCGWGKQNNVKVQIWCNYRGDGINTGPDLIVGIDDWRCVFPKVRLSGEVFERGSYSSRHTGSHRINGIFIVAGPDIQQGVFDGVSICDIAPTILYLFNQPIPSDMEGRVLKELFSMEYMKKNPIQFQTKTASRDEINQDRDDSLTTDDEETIRKQLRDLGYS